VAAGAVDASRWMTSRPSRREISKPQGATEPVGLSSCRCICGYRYEGRPRYRHVRFCCVDSWAGWVGSGPCGDSPGRSRQKMRWQAVCKWLFKALAFPGCRFRGCLGVVVGSSEIHKNQAQEGTSQRKKRARGWLVEIHSADGEKRVRRRVPPSAASQFRSNSKGNRPCPSLLRALAGLGRRRPASRCVPSVRPSPGFSGASKLQLSRVAALLGRDSRTMICTLVPPHRRGMS
jgi:hypothetical protein